VKIQMNKVVLITGASRGLGLVLCQSFIQSGYFVVAAVRKADDMDRLRHDFYDKTIEIIQCDVTNSADVNRLRDYISSRFGRIDVIVNNAGVLPDNAVPGEFLDHSIIETSLDTFRSALEVNTLGVISIIQALLPLLKSSENGEKKIVNISSKAGQVSSLEWGLPAYSVSKVALNAVTKLIASEFAEEGICCVSVTPGWVKTDMGGEKATRDVADASKSLIKFIMNLSPKDNGRFFSDGQVIDW